MRRICECVQETNRDGCYSFSLHYINHSAQIVFVERRNDRSIPRQALTDVMDIPTRDELLGFAILHLIELSAMPAGNGVAIRDTRRHQEQYTRSPPLEECIQSNSGAMYEEIDLVEGRELRIQSLEHAAGGVLGSCRYLSYVCVTCFVLEDKIGEGPANIRRDPESRHDGVPSLVPDVAIISQIEYSNSPSRLRFSTNSA